MLFRVMTILLIVPVALIMGLLLKNGAPALSWEFFTEDPRNGMTEGGIFPALVGTLWLVSVALVASVPLGVAAAIYLSEYAKDNLLTRAINLAIINALPLPALDGGGCLQHLGEERHTRFASHPNAAQLPFCLDLAQALDGAAHRLQLRQP